MPASGTVSRAPYLWLRPRDQKAVAALTLLALLAAVGYWWMVRGDDGQQLVHIGAESAREIHFRVDINQATWPELAQLPRIGETLARRIVALRQSAGPYQSLQDLRRVRGIGPKTIEQVEPYLMGFGGSGPPEESDFGSDR